MSALFSLSAKLACKDWLHEGGISICGILALASMLAPLLILHGVHMGVVENLRESLLRDPAVLVVVPASGGAAGFDEDFLNRAAQADGMRYVIGRPRDVASELQMQSADGRFQVLNLEPTSAGDPLLHDYGMPMPHSRPGNLEVVLSYGAAAKLNAKGGDVLKGSLGRRLSSGKFTRTSLSLHVLGVLPAIAGSRDTAFVDLPLLNAIQDFRDGLDAPLIGEKGELPHPKDRHYESFRAYAMSLDSVPALEAWFKERSITVNTRARDIEAIKKIDSSLATVIGLIAIAGCVGFFAFMASTARAAARRKWKQMGMLKLIGFNKFAIIVYPVTQALLTATAGCLLAFLVYVGVAWAIDYLFAEQTGGFGVCKISIPFLCAVYFCVQFLAAISTLRSAFQAAAISPASVLRDS